MLLQIGDSKKTETSAARSAAPASQAHLRTQLHCEAHLGSDATPEGNAFIKAAALGVKEELCSALHQRAFGT
eukprot:CAMPEP_0195056876 /NCGR_PEP_ID=MMETSP0448-20130528/5129_1 /TAXON_ID=66468 /ORGANISM="Heterocapsa triquestra, Strain CCMP 448" /LENGTH=71 /DNA_ID=CAMNT_0040086757 /DNA_START=117 /DNA_END=331 /DNA_ORIENTATION=+